MRSQTLSIRQARKAASRRFILTLMHSEEVISQTSIVEKTGIRPGTVQALVEELVNEGLVRVSGEGQSKGGRKPRLLEINPDSRWTIGIDVDEERVFAGLVDLRGNVVREVGKTRYLFKSQEEFLDVLKQVIRELLPQVPRSTLLQGIGIGVPGFVDREKGVARHCSYYDWMRDVPLRAILEKEFALPFIIENDTVVATLGEKWFGGGKGIDDFIYVDLGETVGMGIVVGGRLYTGSGGNAGELGHTVIQRNGPLCVCGNEGCVEAFASGMALRREAREIIDKGVVSLLSTAAQKDDRISLEAIIDAAAQGDKVAYRLIADMTVYFGLAISNMVNVLNPRVVILGGSLMGARDFVTDAVTTSIKAHCLSPIAAGVKVIASALAEKSGILGASTLVNQSFFDFDLRQSFS